MNVILSFAGLPCVGMCDCRPVKTNVSTQTPAPERKVNAKRRVAEVSGKGPRCGRKRLSTITLGVNLLVPNRSNPGLQYSPLRAASRREVFTAVRLCSVEFGPAPRSPPPWCALIGNYRATPRPQFRCRDVSCQRGKLRTILSRAPPRSSSPSCRAYRWHAQSHG